MATPRKAIEFLLSRYGFDPSDEGSEGKLFEKLLKNLSQNEIDLIGEYLLAAESERFDYEKKVHELPELTKATQAIYQHGSSRKLRSKNAMTKARLVASVSKETGLAGGVVSNIIDTMFEAISKSLQRQEDVRIIGFGTFSVLHRKATTGRNPRTGEVIKIPVSKQPKFKAGKNLKDAVN